ncbi:sodium/mannose cotransporter SLC5A10-like isoform X1 [Macrobrachium rosenbergii]|uniref:sodium/mannose cotransporter SLC5A10-like isoform X1 n=1 Tax=Macrobrachium rosenbergii TaxID=79674 RepID=UPI0034D66C56
MSAESNYSARDVGNISFPFHNGTDFSGETLSFGLHIVDGAIIIVYLVFSIGMGLYLGRKHETAADYFLAGRSTTWPFIGLSLFASDVSSSSLVGLAGDAYSTGISVFNYVWMASVSLIFVAVFFIPTILRLELYTMPEFLERRYNAATRYYLSSLSVLISIIGSTASGLFAGSLVMNMIFPQLKVWHSVAILAMISGAYTVSGGLKAVIYTDAFQSVVLLLGSVLISIYALIEAGGWSAVRSAVPAEALSLIRPVDDPGVPWTGLISGVPMLGLYYWCCHQTIAQRILSSKDSNQGRLGCLLAGLLRIPVLFIMVLPGTMARVIYPDLPKADLVYPTLLFQLLPTGVRGIVLSGFLAALMSQVDSILNSTSTLVTMDFVKKLKPDLKDKQLLNIGRFVTFLSMVISVCWAPTLQNFSSLYKFSQSLLSYMIPPVVAVYMGGFFWKGANVYGAITALVLGNIWGVALFVIIRVVGLFEMHFLHAASILFALSALSLVVVSLTVAKPCSEDQLKVTWSTEQFAEEIKSFKELPLWKNYFLYCILLIIATLIVICFFW